MRFALLLSLVLASSALIAQTPQPPAPAAPAPKPPTPKPAPKPAAANPTRTGMLITATNPRGATLPGVRVDVTGPVTREGTTDENGSLRLTGMRAGTYRARFSGEEVVTFEREIVVRANQIVDVDVTLTAAEPKAAPAPPPPPPPPPAPEAPPVGPAGQPRTSSIVNLAEKELIGRNTPRKETLVACSGNTRTTLVQLNQEQPQRLYENAELLMFVVAGEGTVTFGGKDTPITYKEASFVSIPRGVPYVVTRRGNRPLILLAILAGEPCEQAQ